MQGIEQTYCSVCIGAVIAARTNLFESSAAEALNRTRYGKNDTLGLDAIPEIAISRTIRNFDGHSILITEELDAAAKRRWPTDADRLRQPIMFFSDPTDRSKYLRDFIKGVSEGRELEPVGRLLENEATIAQWDAMFEPPASITGATTSITCVRKGEIIFSVILNYVTQTLFVAVPEGVFFLKIPRYDDKKKLRSINLAYVLEHGKRLSFLPSQDACQTADDYKRFVTFLGKEGYEENFDDCMIFLTPREKDAFLHHKEPGGPSRVLYLSELQKGYGPIGFVMANGEKIGEWIHWLAFALFANKDSSLKIFEVATDRPWVKDGVLMSTASPYSVFSQDGDTAYLDMSQLRNFPKPSKFRSMLVVTPRDNDRIIQIMWQYNYREITLRR